MLSRIGIREGDFPHAERACEDVLAIPVYPELPMVHSSILLKRLDLFIFKPPDESKAISVDMVPQKDSHFLLNLRHLRVKPGVLASCRIMELFPFERHRS